jgi:hypothetical protein
MEQMNKANNNTGAGSTVQHDFNATDLTKQLESLRNQINSSHLQSIGVRVNPSQLDNSAKKLEKYDYRKPPDISRQDFFKNLIVKNILDIEIRAFLSVPNIVIFKTRLLKKVPPA